MIVATQGSTWMRPEQLVPIVYPSLDHQRNNVRVKMFHAFSLQVLQVRWWFIIPLLKTHSWRHVTARAQWHSSITFVWNNGDADHVILVHAMV